MRRCRRWDRTPTPPCPAGSPLPDEVDEKIAADIRLIDEIDDDDVDEDDGMGGLPISPASLAYMSGADEGCFVKAYGWSDSGTYYLAADGSQSDVDTDRPRGLAFDEIRPVPRYNVLIQRFVDKHVIDIKDLRPAGLSRRTADPG